MEMAEIYGTIGSKSTAGQSSRMHRKGESSPWEAGGAAGFSMLYTPMTCATARPSGFLLKEMTAMSHSDSAINTYIHDHQADFIDLLCQIITIPSPTGQEEKKADWILDYLHRIGQTQACKDDAGNILCPVQTDGKTTFPLYNAHMDTVFSQGTDLTPHIDGHILAAPSCGDNSAGIASLLFFLTMMKNLHLTLPQGALFAFNVGEEGMGNLKGMRRIMADWGGRISEVLAVDCTFDEVVSIPVGSHRYRVAIEAQGGHSWMHFGNTSAIAAASSIIAGLYGLTVPSQPKTTYNIGTIRGGTTVNSIAAHAEFTADLRSESHAALSELDEAFQRIVVSARKDGIAITSTSIGERPCSADTDNSPLCQRIASIRRAHGLDTRFISGSTDANIPLSLGVPAISFGVCRSHGEHTTDESLELDTIETGLQLLAAYMLS